MVKLNAYKDGLGNIVLTEESFDFLLNCLDNQKALYEFPYNKDEHSVESEKHKLLQLRTQENIDHFNEQCRKVQYSKIDVVPSKNYLWLKKRFEGSNVDIMWQLEDVYKIIDTLGTKSNIERSLSTDYYHLTISDDCENNRPWTDEEIEKISMNINN